jgi:single-strand DNA-binding protein
MAAEGSLVMTPARTPTPRTIGSPEATPPQRAARPAASEADGDEGAKDPTLNHVVLQGRVAAPVDERELPSGDTIMTGRLIVDRDAVALTRSSQRVDTIDCVAWLRRVQRSMRGWQAGDRVEVTGAIRRRFFRGVSGPVSRVEVEIRATRRLDRPARRRP